MTIAYDIYWGISCTLGQLYDIICCEATRYARWQLIMPVLSENILLGHKIKQRQNEAAVKFGSYKTVTYAAVSREKFAWRNLSSSNYIVIALRDDHSG